MKPIGLLSQILAIGLAFAIAIFFVQPTLAEIGDLQDEIQLYSTERERVNDTNLALANLVAELEAVAVSDRERLAIYMPQLLDEVSVLRDIEIIAQNAGVEYDTIEYVGELLDSSEEARLGAENTMPFVHEFTLAVEGSYSRLKDFMSLLEQNHYPLQLNTVTITAREAGFLSAEISLVTYITTGSEIEE